MRYKRRLLVLLLIITILGIAGCTSRDRPKNIDEILESMENKYGEKFEYIYSLEDSAAEGTSAYLVKCDSLPGKDILVNVTNSENGSYSYTDNYIDHFFEKDLLDRINEACSAVYGNFKVFYDASNSHLSEETELPTSFEEYMSSRKTKVVITIILNEENDPGNKDIDYARLEMELIAREIEPEGKIYYASNEVYDDITKETIDQFTEKDDWYFEVGIFIINSNDKSSIGWR
jgi:hypothetical protein